ncbi:MAG: hypothetical protein RIF33_08560 [Cyclobacteriaceae bacterium]
MLTELQQKKQTHLFRLIDVDHNGFMEAADWVTIGQRLAEEQGIKKGQPAYDQIQQGIHAIWKDLSKFISSKHPDKATLEEWMKFIEEKVINVDDATYDRYVNRVVDGIFSTLDLNKNGLIDAWEYILFLKCVGVKDGPAHDAFTLLDHNGDGVLDESELIKSVEQFLKSEDADSKGNSLFGPLDSFYHF